MVSISGIGVVTARTLLAETPELGTIGRHGAPSWWRSHVEPGPQCIPPSYREPHEQTLEPSILGP